MPSKRRRQALDSSSQGSSSSSSTLIEAKESSTIQRLFNYFSPALKRQKIASSLSTPSLDNVKRPPTHSSSIHTSLDDPPMPPASGFLDLTPSKPMSEVTTSSLTMVNADTPLFSALREGAIRDPSRRTFSTSSPSFQPALLTATRHSSEEAAEILGQDSSPPASPIPPVEPANSADAIEGSSATSSSSDEKLADEDATHPEPAKDQSTSSRTPEGSEERKPAENGANHIEGSTSAEGQEAEPEKPAESLIKDEENAQDGAKDGAKSEVENQADVSTQETSAEEKGPRSEADAGQNALGQTKEEDANLPTDADVDHIEAVSNAKVGEHLDGPLDWAGALSDEARPESTASVSDAGQREPAEDGLAYSNGALVVDLISDSEDDSDLGQDDPDKENDVSLVTASPRLDTDTLPSSFTWPSQSAVRPSQPRFSFNGPLASQLSRRKQLEGAPKGLFAQEADTSMSISLQAGDLSATEQVRSIGRQSHFVQPVRRLPPIASTPQQSQRPAGRDRSLSISSLFSGSSSTGKRRSSGYRKRDPILNKQHQHDVAAFQASMIKRAVQEANHKINTIRLSRHQPLINRYHFQGLARKAQQLRKILDAENATEASPGEFLELMMKRLMRQRQQDAHTAILPLPPTKMAERERLKKEERAKLKKLRGVLGRKALPARMSDEQEAQATVALKKQGRIADIPGASVDAHDVQKLLPRQWLNDEVINFYGNLILQRANEADQKRKEAMAAAAKDSTTESATANVKVKGAKGKPKRPYDPSLDAFWRVHFFSSFFWESLKNKGFDGVKRWTRRIDIFSKDIILFPINLGNAHWVCGAINFRRRRFEYYDSMGSPNPRAFQLMRTYVSEEAKDKKKKEIDLRGWRDVFSDETPQQENGYDCGVFAAQTLEQISRRDPHYPIPLDGPVIVWKGDGLDEGARRMELGNGEDEDDDDDEYEWNFGQENMSYLRRRMAYEIAAKKLLD